MKIERFEDIEAWKEARKLVNMAYDISDEGSFFKDLNLKAQIRSGSISVMSNIAEGYERGGNQELIQFLSIAKGSCGEVRSQLYVAMDQGYVGKEQCESLIDVFKRLSIMLNNFMEYLKWRRSSCSLTSRWFSCQQGVDGNSYHHQNPGIR